MCDCCSQAGPSRRSLLLGGAALATIPLVGRVARAQPVSARRYAGCSVETNDRGQRALRGEPAARTGFLCRTRQPRTWSGSLCSYFKLRKISGSHLSWLLIRDQELVCRSCCRQFRNDRGPCEFGVWRGVLGTKLIMVLGHSSCGAVNATVAALQKGNDLPGHIADLVRAMKPGIEEEMKKAGPDLEQRAVVANVRHNVKRLEQATPILAEMVAEKAPRGRCRI